MKFEKSRFKVKNFTIILALLILTSCGTTKEMRRSNRAAKKLERLVAKHPELKRTDTVLTKVSMKTPELTGTIIQPLLVPGDKEFITLPGKPIFLPGEIEPFSISFTDTAIDALFSYTGGNFMLDYTIKPIPVDTLIKTPFDTIQPTIHEKDNFIQKKLKVIVAIIIAFLAGVVIQKIFG